GGALAALAEARQLLLTGRADLVVAGSCDALPEEVRTLYPDAPPSGAEFFVLIREDGAKAARGAILGGGAAFGKEARARAVAAACREAALDQPPEECRDGLASGFGQRHPSIAVAVDALGGASALIVT